MNDIGRKIYMAQAAYISGVLGCIYMTYMLRLENMRYTKVKAMNFAFV